MPEDTGETGSATDTGTDDKSTTDDGKELDESNLGEAGLKALQAERARNKELEAKLKEAEPLAAKARELEEANKSESQRKDEALAAAEERAAKAETERLRDKIAADKGLPRGAEDFLSGNTKEEIEASADALVKLLGDSTKGERRPDRSLGQDKQPPAKTPDDWLREAARR